MWWQGDEPLAVEARRVLSPDAIQELQTYLLRRHVAAHRRAVYGRRCIEQCGRPAREQRLRCDTCQHQRNDRIRRELNREAAREFC